MTRSTDIAAFCILPEASIREAIQAIDKNLQGIVLIIDDNKRLLATITDGDIRRAVLSGIDLDTPVHTLIAHKIHSRYPRPLSAPVGTTDEDLLHLMQKYRIRQIPLLNTENKVVGLATFEALIPQSDLPLQAMVMAGGFGTRLHPLTETLPKPMLPIGGQPLLERLLKQLRKAGISRVNISTHYKAEKIVEHFGNGQGLGIDLNYVSEENPLGTAGAVGLIEKPDDPLLIINGDILTDVDFRAMLHYHREQRADMTIGVRQYEHAIPYGVVKSEGSVVKGLEEKPRLRFFINAGIYLMQPDVYHYIPSGKRYDMTEFIQALLDAEKSVISFPILEYWQDIGQHEDYAKAQEDMRIGRVTH